MHRAGLFSAPLVLAALLILFGVCSARTPCLNDTLSAVDVLEHALEETMSALDVLHQSPIFEEIRQLESNVEAMNGMNATLVRRSVVRKLRREDTLLPPISALYPAFQVLDGPSYQFTLGCVADVEIEVQAYVASPPISGGAGGLLAFGPTVDNQPCGMDGYTNAHPTSSLAWKWGTARVMAGTPSLTMSARGSIQLAPGNHTIGVWAANSDTTAQGQLFRVGMIVELYSHVNACRS